METDDIQQALEQIRRHMDRLRSQDSIQRFAHLYHLNPCLSAQHIADLEEHYQIALPEDYRRFLQEIGNGSTNPQWGLFPLEDALEIHWEWDRADYFRLPFVPPVSLKDAHQQVEDWGPGLLTLEHTGCGECSYLVVSGTEYGHIWQGQITLPLPAYTRAALPERLRTTYGQERLEYLLSPANTERLTFLSWYAHVLAGR